MSTVTGGQGNIVTNGLVLNLDAANPRSYPQPYNGVTWFDISGNSRNGTLTNGPTYNAANGGSIVFDGTNDYTFIPQNSIFDFNTFTCTAWVKTATPNRAISFIGDYPGNNFTLYKYFFGLHSTGALRVNYANVVAINGVRVLTNNVWYYVVVTYSSPNTVLYVNGVIDLSSTAMSGNLKVLNGGTFVGASGPSYDFFNGNISQNLIYNRALSQQEVLQNFNATRARFGV
jgi:hypothetical protein